MDTLIEIIITAVTTTVVSSGATYAAFIHKLKSRTDVQEAELRHVKEDVARIDKRLEKKANQFDEIQKELSDIKVSIASLSTNLQASLELLKKTV